uniref:Ubiquitin-like protease family profile domain-containing protein n=1 Tax=Strigamia maritima TaxID=126957 RepID=T1JMP2_STRMM
MNCEKILQDSGTEVICLLINSVPDVQLYQLTRVRFWALELFWNLLKKVPAKTANILTSVGCMNALSVAFFNTVSQSNGKRMKELRNDFLLLFLLLLQNNRKKNVLPPLFIKELAILATSSEIKQRSETGSSEDYEMKEFLLSILKLICGKTDYSAFLNPTILIESLLIHLHPLSLNVERKNPFLSQQKTLQTLALQILGYYAPEYLKIFLVFKAELLIVRQIVWCFSGDILTQKRFIYERDVYMRSCLQILVQIVGLRNLEVSIGEHGEDIIIKYLMILHTKDNRALPGHNMLLTSVINCIRCSIIGIPEREESFKTKNGVSYIVDLILDAHSSIQDLILACLLDFCSSSDSTAYILKWRGPDNMTTPMLLCRLWREEEKRLGIKRDDSNLSKNAHYAVRQFYEIRTGKLLVGKRQMECTETELLSSYRMSAAILDASENFRAKIYGLIEYIKEEGTEAEPPPELTKLPLEEMSTLTLIEGYLDLKGGEVWTEILSELTSENLNPLAMEQEFIYSVSRIITNRVSSIMGFQRQCRHLLQDKEKRNIFNYYQQFYDWKSQEKLLIAKTLQYLAKTSNPQTLRLMKEKQLLELTLEQQKTVIKVRTTIDSPVTVTGNYGIIKLTKSPNSGFADDNSTDEEADFEYIKSTKRRKLAEEVEENVEDMATWIRPPKKFSQCFFYTKEKPPTHDVVTRENNERLFVRPKHVIEKSPVTYASRSTLTNPHFYTRHDDENDENKCVRKSPISDSRSKDLEKRAPQRPSSKNRLLNGSHHANLFNHKCDHECDFSPRSSITERNSASMLTVCRCTQLQEKEKYRQLLNRYPQPFTPIYGNDSLSLRHNANHNLTKLGSFHKNSVTKERINVADTEQQIQRILKSGYSNSKTKQPQRWNVNISNGLCSPTNGDSLVEKSAKLDRPLTYLPKTVPVNQRTPTTFVNEVPRWKFSRKITHRDNENEKKRQIAEAKKTVDVLKPPWEKEFRELEKNIKDQLSIAEKQSEVLEEIYTIKDDKDALDDEKIEPMPELSPEMEKKIDGALRPKPPNEILIDKFQIPIHRRDMETLQDLNWLNDAIINFYMNLLMERGKLDNMPSVYACNTFFYPKLITGGHAALKRWTRKTDIFSYDIMLVPVHLGVHWCLAVVDFRNKMIKYYDSMRGKNNECLNALSTYLKEESLDKKKQTLSMDDWVMKNVSKAPQQMNSSDCGMFACKYAEYITRNAEITFKQHHMPYFRRRMVYEILTAQLL